MTLADILNEVRELSNNDKLALIEATAQMLRQAEDKDDVQPVEIVAEVAAPYRVSDGVAKMRELLIELGNRPNPRPEQMLTYGLFKGKLKVTDEDFRAAEWHPTDEEMDGE
ncbi:MAG: hypothetical protein KJZ86_17400 [Caldilineaceae bacterium]|nr:hypothetical protein [Caldilineaceae bacterium]